GLGHTRCIFSLPLAVRLQLAVPPHPPCYIQVVLEAPSSPFGTNFKKVALLLRLPETPIRHDAVSNFAFPAVAICIEEADPIDGAPAKPIVSARPERDRLPRW